MILQTKKIGKKSFLNHKSGFILIEAVIALCLCVVLVTVSLTLSNGYFKSVRKLNDKMIDFNAISNHLELLRVLDWNDENILMSGVMGYHIEDTEFETKKLCVDYLFGDEREYRYEIERSVYK